MILEYTKKQREKIFKKELSPTDVIALGDFIFYLENAFVCPEDLKEGFALSLPILKDKYESLKMHGTKGGAQLSKYIGMVIEGRWRVIDYFHPDDSNDYKYKKFKLQNVYNNEIILLTPEQFKQIRLGKKSIGKITSNKIKRRLKHENMD